MRLCLNRRAYYNENNKYAAQWLRNLIQKGLIADGEVDERSIAEVRPQDLRGYKQCHFFAGIGGWSYALRLAGVPDDVPVWTGSCPCQPFSSAGRQDGFSDERHLWPVWFNLISECHPEQIFGEQVATAIGKGWADIVQSDLEDAGYAFGFSILGAHSAGAPHKRNRMYWVGNSVRQWGQSSPYTTESTTGYRMDERPSASSELANANISECTNARRVALLEREIFQEKGRAEAPNGFADNGDLGNPQSGRCLRKWNNSKTTGGSGIISTASRENFWSNCEWRMGVDGKARCIEPGVEPLVNGFPCRVEQLRAYGNAIVPQTAATFIKAVLDKK